MRIALVEGVSPDDATLAEAAACIATGGTLIFPTDTVYGIGCDPDDASAIEAIFTAKRRPLTKPLAIHLDRPELAAGYAERLTPAARKIIEHFWPGAVTIIVERKKDRVEAAALGGSTIALRCPDAQVCRAILSATGPLAATSANISGAPAYAGEDGNLASLPDATLAIIAGPTKERRESTVLDCSADVVRVVRAGVLSPAKIEAALNGIAAFESGPKQ